MHRRFCGSCGGRVSEYAIDPYTGETIVEVEVHAVPDDVCSGPEPGPEGIDLDQLLALEGRTLQ